MRQAFAHEAVVIMEAGGDTEAPGAAITDALCGRWQQNPPCPPHHTTAQRFGDEVRVRVLFVTETSAEAEVRRLIEVALSQGGLEQPDGVITRWRFRTGRASPVRKDEAWQCAQF